MSTDADDLTNMLMRMQNGDPAFADNITVLPADEFDRFVGTLDEPDPAPKLRRLFSLPTPFRRQEDEN